LNRDKWPDSGPPQYRNEVRGTAAVIPSGGKAFGERFEDTIVRIQPTRIISFGIDPGETTTARSVSAT
jgi:hypothetical protein